MNRCGGLIDWRGAPLLRAHGAAMGASMIVLVVRHGRHQLAPCTSLSTGPCRSGASSETVSSSVLAVHLKNEGQEVTQSPSSFYCSAVVCTRHRATTLNLN